MLWTTNTEMPFPSAIVRQINVLMTQAALTDAGGELATMALRLVLVVRLQYRIMTRLTLVVIILARTFT